MKDKLIAAYEQSRNGYSSDRVLADPDLRAKFLELCRVNGLTDTNDELARLLLNFRKRGDLSALKSRRTVFRDEEYRFASEIAIRHIERKLNRTLDDVLCSESLLNDFDEICAGLCKGFTKLQHRWAALRLRKSRSIPPEILSHAVPSASVSLIKADKIVIEEIPNSSGLYLFLSLNSCLYVGEASNLKSRIRKHLEHSDNKKLARHIWDQGLNELTLELHVLPQDIPTKIRRALEVELIRSRRPIFNVLGVLA